MFQAEAYIHPDLWIFGGIQMFPPRGPPT